MGTFFVGWGRKAGVVTLLLAFVFVVCMACFAVNLVMESRAAAKESAQRALLVESHDLLSGYYVDHGIFPKTLQELPFTYPDGGNSTLLREVRYERQDNECQISVRLACTGKVSTDRIGGAQRPTNNAPFCEIFPSAIEYSRRQRGFQFAPRRFGFVCGTESVHLPKSDGNRPIPGIPPNGEDLAISVTSLISCPDTVSFTDALLPHCETVMEFITCSAPSIIFFNSSSLTSGLGGIFCICVFCWLIWVFPVARSA